MELKIQAVCGFGCGSSLFLRIKIDNVLSKHGLSARTFCGDVGTACSADCDVIVTRNVKDFSYSRLPILTPKELLSLIN